MWRDRAAFEAWSGAQKKPAGPKAKPAGPPSGAAGGGPPSIYVRPPVPTFYEGILMLESANGV